MEFSEPYELTRMLKIKRSTNLKNPYSYEIDPSQDSIDKMIELAQSIEDCLFYSPPNSHQSLPRISIPEQQDQSTEAPRPMTPEKQPDSPVNIEVERDESYRESFSQSIAKVSSLTRSLKVEDTTQVIQTADMIQLKVYLFGGLENLIISIPKNATVENLITKVISTFMRSPSHRENQLPHGPAPDAYEIWLVDDVSFLPETDFTVDKSMKVRDLGVDALAFCAVSGYSGEPRVSVSQKYMRRVSEIGQCIALKIHFEENSTIVRAEPNESLRDILNKLGQKFSEVSYFHPDEYEFKIEVDLEDAIQQEECGVDLDLQIQALGTTELKLCKKVYADTPVGRTLIKKEMPIVKEGEDMKYDPLRFHMTKAQACAYQEYPIIKVNRRGKRQKRILGIDQIRLYNMTEAMAKAALKGKASGTASHVMRKKLAGIFKSITHHPEIPIATIHKVVQDTKNLHCFYIEYTEDNQRKRKLYEAETSASAAEIMAKIHKLMTLNVSEA